LGNIVNLEIVLCNCFTHLLSLWLLVLSYSVKLTLSCDPRNSKKFLTEDLNNAFVMFLVQMASKSLKCKICNISFDSEEELTEHMKLEHKEHETPAGVD
jgi:hypothetical protein